MKSTLTTTADLSSYTVQILSRYKYAKVHSIFPNGFNLNYEGHLIYITYYQPGKLSALGIMIEKNIFDQLYRQIKIGQLVRFQEDSFTFYIQANPLMVYLKEKNIKDLEVVNRFISKEKIIQLEEYLDKISLFTSSGFLKSQRLWNLYKEIQIDKKMTQDNVNALIGAGIGLTPTGDDFLQGLILTEKILGHSSEIEQKVQMGLKNRSTTDVSLSYYEAIFKGYFNEPLAKLFEAVSQENHEEMKEAILLIQEYGETSGFDLLIGILTYLKTLKE